MKLFKMKNLNITLFLSYSFIAGLIAFSGCIPKKEILPRSGTYTFYGSSSDNIGSITVTVDGTNIKTFSNTIDYCYYTSGNSSYFYTLSVGTHTYTALSDDQSKYWSGTFEVYNNTCNSKQLYASNSINNPALGPVGTYTFYTNYSDFLGTITVTVDGTNIKSFSNTSDYCGYGSSYSSYFYTLASGTHTYIAKTSNLSRSWSGSFTVSTGSCGSKQLSVSNSNVVTTTTPGTSVSNTITDGSGIKIDLSWSLPGTSFPTSYADLELNVENPSGSSYSSSTSSSSFESINFPTSGTALNLSDGTYYVSVRPYSISSSYSYASYSVKFTGINTGITYTYNSTTPFYYSSSSYTRFVKIVKSGSSFNLSLY